MTETTRRRRHLKQKSLLLLKNLMILVYLCFILEVVPVDPGDDPR